MIALLGVVPLLCYQLLSADNRSTAPEPKQPLLHANPGRRAESTQRGPQSTKRSAFKLPQGWCQNSPNTTTNGGRLVYIDAGTNWANTLRLYKDVGCVNPDGPGWEVYGFEASPLITPFVEDFTEYLNGNRATQPDSGVPRSGSSAHLFKIGEREGCACGNIGRTRNCMWKKYEAGLHRLAPRPSLLRNWSLIRSRLEMAKTRVTHAQLPRYTFVPAAVGGNNGTLQIWGDPRQLVRGGALPKGNRNGEFTFDVPVVDMATWMVDNFRESDWIILKMDVEGGEHPFFEKLFKIGGAKWIDRLIWECHGPCHKLKSQLGQHHIVTMMEGGGYGGFDSSSMPDTSKPKSSALC